MTLKDAISQVTTGGNEKEINLRMAFEEIAM